MPPEPLDYRRLARGPLLRSDKWLLGACLFLFMLTGAVGIVMPRLCHN